MRDLTLETAAQHDARAGLRASALSIAWTLVTSSASIGLGIGANSVVLVAFGGVGLFDMLGSIALVSHFRHALHHEAFSERRERIAQLVVGCGMLVVAVATLAVSGIRLAGNGHSSQSVAGLVVSSSSIAVLGYLGARKQAIGRRIPSPALVSDGWLSLVGGATATCVVAGLAFEDAFGWSWVDPLAAIAVAVGAAVLALFSLRGGR